MAKTLTELNKLENIIRASGQDELVSSTVKKLLSYKKKELKESLKRLDERLNEFEKLYKISSKAFESRYLKGQMGDATDFIQWHATLDMQKKIKEQLKRLNAN